LKYKALKEGKFNVAVRVETEEGCKDETTATRTVEVIKALNAQQCQAFAEGKIPTAGVSKETLEACKSVKVQ